MIIHLSDLKVIYYLSIQESNRWGKPVANYWKVMIEYYIMMDKEERKRLKRDYLS